MSLICSDNALLGFNEAILAAQVNWTLRLFKNNKTPALGDVEADYVEADFDGYAGVSLAATFSGTTVTAHVAESHTAGHTFTATGGGVPNDIYGYYVTDGSGLVFAERAAGAPVPISNLGDFISVMLSFTTENKL